MSIPFPIGMKLTKNILKNEQGGIDFTEHFIIMYTWKPDAQVLLTYGLNSSLIREEIEQTDTLVPFCA